MVLSIDEKTQVQALDRTQPLLPIDFGVTEKRTHDYIRHGTTNLFAALEVGSGEIYGECHPTRDGAQFLAFLKAAVKPHAGKDIHVVLDNLSTHTTPDVAQWLTDNPHVSFHFTPIGSSWMNQIETWFGIITRQAIRRGTFTSVKVLIKTIRDYIEHWNADAQPFAWTATTDEILLAFNNAGMDGEQVPLHEQDIEKASFLFDVNIKGVFYCMKYEIEQMLRTGGGAIVNTSSIFGLNGYPGWSLYVGHQARRHRHDQGGGAGLRQARHPGECGRPRPGGDAAAGEGDRRRPAQLRRLRPDGADRPARRDRRSRRLAAVRRGPLRHRPHAARRWRRLLRSEMRGFPASDRPGLKGPWQGI